MNRFARLSLPGALVLASSAANRPATAAVIGVDAVHGWDASSILGTGAIFDEFRMTITGLGHTIVLLNSFSAGDLAGLDAVVLMTPYSQNRANYTAGEIAAVQSYAGRASFVSDSSMWSDDDTNSDRPIGFGDNRRLLENIISYSVVNNGILVVGDNGSGFQVDNLNDLVDPFGITYADIGTEGSGHTITDFVAHPLTNGLGSIGVDFQLRITVVDPSLDLTIGSGADDALAVLPGPGALPLLGGLAMFGLRRRRRS